jgi:hypothetical protein
MLPPNGADGKDCSSGLSLKTTSSDKVAVKSGKYPHDEKT